MATELADGDRVSFAIQADITHDFLAAVYPILNIGIEVVANLLAVREVIQGDLLKGQEAGDLLQKRYSNVRQTVACEPENSEKAAPLPSSTIFLRCIIENINMSMVAKRSDGAEAL